LYNEIKIKESPAKKLHIHGRGKRRNEMKNKQKRKGQGKSKSWPIHPIPSMQPSTIVKHRESPEKENKAKEREPGYPQTKAHPSSAQVS
jgi:hypothetical protein